MKPHSPVCHGRELESFLVEHGEDVTGVIRGFDRLRLRASLRWLYQPSFMKRYLCEARGRWTLNGIRNRDGRAALYKPTNDDHERRRQSGRVPRLLGLLRAHALIRKVTGTHHCHLTPGKGFSAVESESVTGITLFMRPFARMAGLLSLTLVSGIAATAPDSIAGKVLRNNGFVFTTRSEGTYVFQPDGRFIHLKRAVGARPPGGIDSKVVIKTSTGDGTYTYVRSNDTDAIVGLYYDNGTTDGIPLHFTSATGGGDITFFSTFTLSDYIARQPVPASNVSMRGRVSPGRPLIVGFIVPGEPVPPRVGSTPSPGTKFQEVMIRVVGPSLVSFGMTDLWADPDFQLYKGNSLAVVDEAHSGDWTARTPYGEPERAGLEKIFSYCGAFPLIADSKDAVDVVRLTPGSYTVVCNLAAGDPGGEVLIEVYFLP